MAQLIVITCSCARMVIMKLNKVYQSLRGLALKFCSAKDTYLINQTPGEKLRHGAAILLSATPANS